MTTATFTTDTIESVNAIIKEVEQKMYFLDAFSDAYKGWEQFLKECQQWIKENNSSEDSSAFQVGKTYTYRYIGDCELKPKVTILKRTKSFVTFTDGDGTARRKIKQHNGIEYFMPDGNYSMAPSCSADDLL